MTRVDFASAQSPIDTSKASEIDQQIDESLVRDLSNFTDDEFSYLENSDDIESPETSASAGNSDPEVLSPRLQNVMASFHVYNDANLASRDDLAAIGRALTSIITTQNLGREFLTMCEAELRRANELEQANHRLVVENRRSTEKTEKLLALRERQNENFEAMRRRESRLLQECDHLREMVSSLRDELVELRNNNYTNETQRSEMHLQLAARKAEFDRVSRETDVLRERLVVMSNDLEMSQRKQSETRRKLEELQTTHAEEANRNTDLTGKLAATEKELLRVQKHSDSTDVLLREAGEALQNTEREMADRDRRSESEALAFRNEIEQLNGRLQKVLQAQSVDAGAKHEEDKWTGSAVAMPIAKTSRSAQPKVPAPHRAM